MENFVDIYELLPDEISKAIEKLLNALEEIEKRKNTNSRIIDKEKEVNECPLCKSTHLRKNGHDKNKNQIYECKECGKKFTPNTNTFTSHMKLTYDKLVIFFECMNNKESIRKTSAKMDVNKNTVFLLRHKALDAIKEIREKMKLTGNIEVDETYESINLKGTKPENMPRASKPRSTKGGSKRGISNHQVCIASAVDEHDNCFLEVVGTGPITSEQVKSVFKNKVDNCSLFITDCKSSYEQFCKENNIKLEQVKSGTYVNNNGYSLANINSLHSELSTFLSHFRGVSTKHLQHYLDWFSFQKIINYTVDIIKQPLEMLKKTIINTCDINSNNVYLNHSGINFSQVYLDYYNRG